MASDSLLLDVIQYVTEQIFNIIEGVDTYSEKEQARMFKAIQNIYEQLGVAADEIISKEIHDFYIKGLHDARRLGVKYGAGVYDMKGVKNDLDVLGDLKETPVDVEAIATILSDTMTDLKAAFRTAEQYTIKNISDTIDEVHNEIINGMLVGMTTQNISKRVAMKFGEKGMTAFVTKDGKHLPLDFYARTVARTKKQTATNHAHLNRYEDMGVKYVKVSGNVPTCHECAKYRGVVFSLQPNDPDFPYINLFTTFPKHPHCRCNFVPWTPKFKSKDEIDKEKVNAKKFNENAKDVRSKNEKKRYDAEQKAKQKARRQRLTFSRMQRMLGKDGPRSYEEYKNASKQQYHKWVAQMTNYYDKYKQKAKDDEKKRAAKVNKQILDKLSGKRSNEEERRRKEEERKRKEFERKQREEEREILEAQRRRKERQRKRQEQEIAKKLSNNVDLQKTNNRKKLSAQNGESDFIKAFNKTEIGDMELKNNYAKLYNSIIDNVQLKTSTKKGDYFYRLDNSVNLKTKTFNNARKNDSDGKLSRKTFAHEFGHAIDFNVGEKVRLSGEVQTTPSAMALHELFEGLDLYDNVTLEFYHKMLKDYSDIDVQPLENYIGLGDTAIIDDVIKRTGKTRNEVESIINNAAKKMTKEANKKVENDRQNLYLYSFEQDMLNSFGQRTYLGHSKEYWENDTLRLFTTKRGSEAFAHLSEMLIDKDTYEYITKNYPHSVRTFDEILRIAQDFI
ncbi:phage minor capsid protein [Staphylococcus hominis]|uniref:Minor capsid protein n=1 Tax=Staphylococcus hominis TaxID=1290 RepID=A0A974QNJ9_STAHO|nr:phage minor capsid protein [Staphylococcus hominis]PTK30819.1 hypothetical protein BUZ51_06275 [Staphylococcus hominis]RIO58920.1 hypothetical protein BUZ49_04125 [Staphylococcus hominis]